MADRFYDFENGTKPSPLTINKSSFKVRSDRARGTYSVGVDDGTGSLLAQWIEPEFTSGDGSRPRTHGPITAQ